MKSHNFMPINYYFSTVFLLGYVRPCSTKVKMVLTRRSTQFVGKQQKGQANSLDARMQQFECNLVLFDALL